LSVLVDKPLSHVTVSWKVEPVAGPRYLIFVSCEPVTVKSTESFQWIALAVPATATDLYTQPTACSAALFVMDTKAAAAE
jgi:hypothetical protein